MDLLNKLSYLVPLAWLVGMFFLPILINRSLKHFERTQKIQTSYLRSLLVGWLPLGTLLGLYLWIEGMAPSNEMNLLGVFLQILIPTGFNKLIYKMPWIQNILFTLCLLGVELLSLILLAILSVRLWGGLGL